MFNFLFSTGKRQSIHFISFFTGVNYVNVLFNYSNRSIINSFFKIEGVNNELFYLKFVSQLCMVFHK